MNSVNLISALTLITGSFANNIRLALPEWKLKAAICTFENAPATNYSVVSGKTSGSFLLPDEKKPLVPTAFADSDLEQLAARFSQYKPWGGVISLCHIHSKEPLPSPAVKKFISAMCSNPEVWYASAEKFSRYLACWRQLSLSVDASRAANRGAETLFLRSDKGNVKLAPGEKAVFTADGEITILPRPALITPEPVITPQDRMIFFPDGSRKALGFSFDDGHVNDQRLTALLRKYRMPGTFHLIALRVIQLPQSQIAWYDSHEIATHGLYHIPADLQQQQQLLVNTVLARKVMESRSGNIITGHAYPSGRMPDFAVQALKMAGITYARTTKNTNTFELPADFMLWAPTTHCKSPELAGLNRSFLAAPDSGDLKLCMVWGHAKELTSEKDWQNMENFCASFNGKKVWKATLGDISNYIISVRQLEWGPGKKSVYNPTATTIFIGRNGKLEALHPGMCIKFTDR